LPATINTFIIRLTQLTDSPLSGYPYESREKHTGFSSEEHRQALHLIGLLLDDLWRSSAGHRKTEISVVGLCENEYRVLDLEYEDKLAQAAIIVQSMLVSRELNLYYPEPRLKRLLSHLVDG
jgi:hypothetical protein